MKKIVCSLLILLCFCLELRAQVVLGDVSTLMSTPSISQGANQQSSITIACSITNLVENAQLVMKIGSDKDQQDAAIVTGTFYKTEDHFTVIPSNIQYANGSVLITIPTTQSFYHVAKYITLYVINEQGQNISNVVYYTL